MSNTDFYRALEQATRRIAQGPPDGMARRVHEELDAALAAMPAAAHRACRAGCAFCCHHPVGVTWPEALGLLQALRALAPAQHARLMARITGAAAATADTAWAALGRHPCPLLEADRCAVYAARPAPCRAFASFDRDACDRHHRGSADIPVDSEALAAGLGAAAALAAAAGDTGPRELRAALATMCAAPQHDLAALRAAFVAARHAGD